MSGEKEEEVVALDWFHVVVMLCFLLCFSGRCCYDVVEIVYHNSGVALKRCVADDCVCGSCIYRVMCTHLWIDHLVRCTHHSLLLYFTHHCMH